MEDPILDIVVRSIPALASLTLASLHFSESIIINGIEANKELCRDFDANKDADFPCIRSGTNAYNVASAGISMAISLLICIILTSAPTIRVLYVIMTVFLVCGVFGYIASYKKEIFRVEDALRELNHEFWSKHIGLGANLITLVCSLAFSIMSVMFPILFGQ